MKRHIKKITKAVIYIITAVSILHFGVSITMLEGGNLTPKQALLSGLTACSYMAISIYMIHTLGKDDTLY